MPSVPKVARALVPVALLAGAALPRGAIAAGSVSPPVDYSKRLAPLDPSLPAKLLGRWTNEVDRLVVEISSVDPTSGAIKGRLNPTTGPAAANGHEVVGWVSSAPPKENMDSVFPITFSSTLYEYGTVPVWAGFWRDGKLVTMSYNLWPNRTYSWDHISTFQETWTRLP
jgi:hypothetical protein